MGMLTAAARNDHRARAAANQTGHRVTASAITSRRASIRSSRPGFVSDVPAPRPSNSPPRPSLRSSQHRCFLLLSCRETTLGILVLQMMMGGWRRRRYCDEGVLGMMSRGVEDGGRLAVRENWKWKEKVAGWKGIGGSRECQDTTMGESGLWLTIAGGGIGVMMIKGLLPMGMLSAASRNYHRARAAANQTGHRVTASAITSRRASIRSSRPGFVSDVPAPRPSNSPPRPSLRSSQHRCFLLLSCRETTLGILGVGDENDEEEEGIVMRVCWE
ncbi:hypothetical protein LR48_Vigan11g048700 [Vigna angularis]|uniref:Uncharacterized protein n=1 Tax=Phaseolus angularis TaxID=3914 RepID=A0A0L9VRU7_PHAAN|nr:hypothetical protein LR48_Vigan11g048700 [Vigna angularis]